MIQYIHNVFQFATATKKNKKNSKNVESLSLHEDELIIGGGGELISGGVIIGIFFSVNRITGL